MIREIWCKDNLELDGEIYYREAVRAIIIIDDKALLLHSELNGDYKFPGGGVESGESYLEALTREIKEESGVTLLNAKECFDVVEYDEGQHDGFDIFKMLSKYYFVEIEGNLILSDGESGVKPKWVTLKEAYNVNRKIINSDNPPRWSKRETYVIGELLKRV